MDKNKIYQNLDSKIRGLVSDAVDELSHNGGVYQIDLLTISGIFEKQIHNIMYMCSNADFNMEE